MPNATAVSFFIPRTPVAQSRDRRWTPYRGQAWSAWVSGLRLWGRNVGAITYPVNVKATVRWPRCGVAVTENHETQWKNGIANGLVKSGLVQDEMIEITDVDVSWELVNVDLCGTQITINPKSVMSTDNLPIGRQDMAGKVR